MSGALFALQRHCELRRGKACRLSPHPFAASGSPLRFAPDRFPLTKANTFPHNRVASVATLRWCSGSSRNAVRLPFGKSVQLRRNPHPSHGKAPYSNTSAVCTDCTMAKSGAGVRLCRRLRSDAGQNVRAPIERLLRDWLYDRSGANCFSGNTNVCPR